MAGWAIAVLIYGILCVFIGIMKPPFIWNMGKFKVMEKMMGPVGLRIFVLVWGGAAIAVAVIWG